MGDFLSFELKSGFLDNYRDKPVQWGFPMGSGNTLGEHSWITRYARTKPDGSRERFWEGLARVIGGVYSIQKDYALQSRLPWDEETAHRSAEEAYDRAFHFKWLPPGRSLWMMGTEMVNGRRDGSPLYNCSYLSTENLADDPTGPFTQLMDESMLGIGIGFDTAGAGKVTLHDPPGVYPHVIADSREGWCDAVGCLLRAYFTGSRLPNFDYSRIRPAGSPIKTFGGVAAGSAPLRKGIRQLTLLLRNRAGQPLTSRDIVDIQNICGKIVVSGNVRRTAEIALGDAGDEEFLALKDWEANPDRMGADGWGWLSNNSVYATSGQEYGHLAERIKLNGEPGLYWLDIAQKYGRLADPEDNKEYRTRGVNPCHPAWVRLLTPNGIRTMGEINTGDNIWSEDGWVTVISKRHSGVKTVNRYRTTAGYVDATENHRVVSEGVKVELRDATSVDRLRGGAETSVCDPEDVMRGLLLGDGYAHRTGPNTYLVLDIGVDDQDYFNSEVAPLIIGTHGRDGRHFRVAEILDSKHIEVHLPDRGIPDFLLGNAGVLRGIYSANGSVVGGRVTLKTSSPDMRDDVMVSLSALGIASYYTTNKPSRIEWANGGYTSRESYDVNIGRSDDIRRFTEIIGFIQEYKNSKVEKTIRGSSSRQDKSFDVISVEPMGQHDVWDITVSGAHHTYWAQGMNVSNCGEIPLESYEKCNLAETFPTRADDFQDYMRTLKFAFLFAKSVTLLPVMWPQANEVMARNRRIGVSMSGVAEFAEGRGWHELKRWQDAGYHEIRRWDRVYSEWLGVRESIRVTAVKPSGTVSLLAGVTPGVHWPRERGYYVRTVRGLKGSPFVQAMEEAGYPVEPAVGDPDLTVVITMPVEGPDIRSEREVSIWEKASLAASAQQWWADNGVSCTVTFRADEADQIPAVLRVFDGRLKSISFLPDADDVYPQAPYQRVSKARWDALRAGVKPLNWDMLYSSDSLPEAEGENYCANDVCELPAK